MDQTQLQTKRIPLTLKLKTKVNNYLYRFKYFSTYQKDSHLDFTSFILAEYKPVEKYWPLIEISNIIDRRYLTKRQCVLI